MLDVRQVGRPSWRPGARSSSLFDAGGSLNSTDRFSLLFMAGHTIAGAPHTVAYIALYWTGPRRS
jgi:hypothetical protein